LLLKWVVWGVLRGLWSVGGFEHAVRVDAGDYHRHSGNHISQIIEWVDALTTKGRNLRLPSTPKTNLPP
jgi:hypothetical protein